MATYFNTYVLDGEASGGGVGFRAAMVEVGDWGVEGSVYISD